jgi:hypothetical protein
MISENLILTTKNYDMGLQASTLMRTAATFANYICTKISQLFWRLGITRLVTRVFPRVVREPAPQ